VAVLIVLLQIAGVWLLTLLIGYAPPEAAREIRQQIMKKAGEPIPLGLPLSAEGAGAAAGAGAGHSEAVSDLPESYSRGRAVMMAGLAKMAAMGRPAGDDRRTSDYVSLGLVFGLLLIGSVVAFFGWRMRRLAAALFGAGAFGMAAGIVAADFGMKSWACLCVALPPAFLGALIGWHLMVLVTCVQAATMLTLLTAIPVVLAAGIERLPVIGPMLLGLWALYAAMIYIFMVRSLLISSWALWGAWCLGNVALIATYSLAGVVVPWEIYLLAVGILAVLGVRTQYWLAGRAAAGPGRAEPESAPEPA
jgi:hypothetical protein